MPYRGECGGLKPFVRVTGFAPVEVGLTTELAVMYILVAGGTGGILKLVDDHLRFFNMTLRTLHIRMACLQREVRFVVFRDAEDRRLEALDLMTGRAILAFPLSCKLASVRVLLVTIRTEREGHRFFEIAAAVTRFAGYIDMFSFERVFSVGVVED